MNTSKEKRVRAQTPSRERFKTRPVAVGCAVLMLAASAYAEEAKPTQTLDTVTVTGIRKSIEDAISVKKNADGIVEAISAEDLGKLPDVSIADSIARLPGVAAQRNGEGRASQLSVRGMPPDFSTTLLNGREQVNPNDGRGVEFDAYPTELIGGVVLYKTPDATLPGQGIAGTIDLQTVRPLAFSGRKVMMGASLERNSVGEGPNGSGRNFSLSYIDQFNDRQLGIALGFARRKGNSTGREVNSFDDSGTFSDGTKLPIQVSVTEATRESDYTRDGLMGVVELKASPNYTSTLDLFLSKTDRTTLGHQVAFPKFNSGTLSNAVIVNGTAVAGSISGVTPIVQTIGQQQNDKNIAVGWNNKFKFNDNWSAVVDLAHSQSKRREIDIDSNAAGAVGTLTFDTRGSIPQFGFSSDLTNPSTLLLSQTNWGNGWLKKPSIKDTLDTLRVGVTHNLDGDYFSSYTLGASYAERKKKLAMTEGSLSFKNGGATAALPSSSVVRAGLSDINILGWNSLDLIDTVYTYTDMGDQSWAIQKNWAVTEKVSTIFGKLDIDSKVGGIPVRGNVGVQVVRTDQRSQGLNSATVATWDDSNSGLPNNYAVLDTGIVEDGKSYTDVLPSLALAFDVGSGQVVRVGAGKVLARPTMRDMRAVTTYECWSPASNPKSCSGNHSGSGGNPQLDPFRATTFDLAYEKYFDKRAYVSGAAFYKKLDTFIYQQSFKSDVISSKYGLSGYPTLDYSGPQNGQGGKIYGYELSANAPFDLIAPSLSGFGAYINFSDTRSSVDIPNTIGGSATKMGLPGLSRRVLNLSVYYEKNGFSARVGNRTRSDFIGEFTTNEYTRSLVYVKGESIVDLQMGYEFLQGAAKGLTLTLQANNVTDAVFQKYRKNSDGSKDLSASAKYGRTYTLGATYKF